MSKNPNTDLAVYAVKGGMSPKKAAKATGVHKTTIWRALKKAKTATEQLERVRGSRKREALEMLLSKQMELIYNALERLPPEELDRQGAPFLKDLARTGTVSLGILIDKLAKDEESNGGGITVHVTIPNSTGQDSMHTEQPAEDQQVQDAPTVQVEI